MLNYAASVLHWNNNKLKNLTVEVPDYVAATASTQPRTLFFAVCGSPHFTVWVITVTLPVWHYYSMEPFTHIYCTRCKAIKPAKREPNVIGCAACDTLLLGLDEKECGKCETCGLQPLEHGSLDSEDISGQFLGGDILCNHCRLILATVYKEKPATDSGQKNNAPGFS